jgi:hypothetical protein
MLPCRKENNEGQENRCPEKRVAAKDHFPINDTAGKSFDYRRAPVVFSTRLTIFIPDANHNMLLLKANKYR